MHIWEELCRIRNRSTGEWGERLAVEYLRKKRMKIVARNWRNPRDRREEIDLVCELDGVLVFVEVKTRAASAMVRGFDAVDRRKKAVLLRACSAYLKSFPRTSRPNHFRFDVVEIRAGMGKQKYDLLHFENVPLFGKYFF
ncbi:MAG TPA: YraN family protein [Opitutaceae bacterium]|nr:YraN family protein [Opitutaceae bacterium]